SRSALLLRSGTRACFPVTGSNVRNQPFSCEAGEGGAKRRMRARARRVALPLGRQHQKHASLRSRPLIRPPGTFSRKREKGFFPSIRQQRPDQPFSCAAGQGLVFQSPAATSGTSPSPAKREKVARSAGRGREGSELLLPFQATSKARFAALAPPHPPSGHLLPQTGEGLPPHLSPRGSGSALLLRSGRRASFPTLAARLGISPSPAQPQKVALNGR